MNLKYLKTTRKYGQRANRALGLWVKLARATATFSRCSAEDIRSYGLTQPQFGVLESLGHLGPMTLGELSRKQLSSCGNITVVVDNLEKEGLVRREHRDKDRRVIHVALTRKGRQFFDRIFSSHARRITELASVLTENEQEELSRLLKKLGLALAAGRR